MKGLALLASLLAVAGCKQRRPPAPKAGGPATAAAPAAAPARARDTRCDGAACLPDYDFVPIDGAPITAASLKGKIVLVSFWASYCEPCTQELGGFSGLYARHRHDGFELLGISLDSAGDDKLRALAAHYYLKFPIVRATPELLHAFGDPKQIPTTMLFGRDGQRVWLMTGTASDVIVEGDVSALVKGQKVMTSIKKPTPAAASGDGGAASHTM